MIDHAERLRRAAREYAEADAQATAIRDAADRRRIAAAKAANHEGRMGARRIARHLGVSHTIVVRLLRR